MQDFVLNAMAVLALFTLKVRLLQPTMAFRFAFTLAFFFAFFFFLAILSPPQSNHTDARNAFGGSGQASPERGV